MRQIAVRVGRCILGIVLSCGAFCVAAENTAHAGGLIAVCVQGSYAACGLINRDGNWVLKPWYSKIEWGGIGWRMETWGTVGMLTPEGKEMFAPRFSRLENYAEGLAPAEELLTEKWGFVDARGNWVITPQFMAASQFHGATGTALRRREGHPDDAEWGLIDRQGRWIRTLPDYFEASPKEPAPLAWFKKAEWKDWYLQRSSLELLDSQGGDFVRAQHENEEHYLDLTGHPILMRRKQAFCGRVDEVRNSRGERIWPNDPDAMCRDIAHKYDHDLSAETPAMRERIAEAHRDWIKHERMIDDARLSASDGGVFPFLKREPSMQAIAEAYRKAPWQAGGEVRLAEGISLALPGDARYLAPEAAAALGRREEHLLNIFQARMLAARAASQARKGGTAAPAEMPAVPSADDSTPDEGAASSSQSKVAWIAPPNRRWKTQIMVLDRGHLSLDSLTQSPDVLLERVRSSRFFDMSGRKTQAMLDSASFRWVIEPHVDKRLGAYVHAEATLGACRVFWAVPGREQTVILLTEWNQVACESKIDFYSEEVEALAKNVRFASGHAYADWKPGEPQASLTLDQLAEGPPSEDSARLQQGVSNMLKREEAKRSIALWKMLLGIALVALVLVTGAATRGKRR